MVPPAGGGAWRNRVKLVGLRTEGGGETIKRSLRAHVSPHNIDAELRHTDGDGKMRLHLGYQRERAIDELGNECLETRSSCETRPPMLAALSSFYPSEPEESWCKKRKKDFFLFLISESDSFLECRPSRIRITALSPVLSFHESPGITPQLSRAPCPCPCSPRLLPRPPGPACRRRTPPPPPLRRPRGQRRLRA